MAITASGYFGLTLEKMFTNAAALNLETAADLKVGMITDSATPNFDTHDFWAALSANEVTDSLSVYVAGGKAPTTPAVTVGSPAAGQIRFSIDNVSWAASSISNAMASVVYHDTPNDELFVLNDFVTAASTSNGTFTIDWNDTNGVGYFDFTP